MNELFPLINKFKEIPGAISVTEAIALHQTIQESLETPSFTRNHLGIEIPIREIFIDFGSYAGKSSLIAMAALSDLNKRGNFVMVDPIYNKEENDYPEKIKTNIIKFVSPFIVPIFVKSTSEEAIKSLSQLKVSYAFIDTGEHSEESLSPEIKYLEDVIIKGGLIILHDFGNQYIAPKEAAVKLVNTGKFEFIEINWESIIKFVEENKLEEGNISWHMPGMDFPNFIGAIRRK